MLIKVNFCNILQHLATFLYATFLKKYAIKKCKLDEVAVKIYFIEFLKNHSMLVVGRCRKDAAFAYLRRVVMACKGKKRK